MSNPAVVTLASLQESIPSFPYRFEIEDNVGEAIHVHFKDIRLDLTVKEFLRLADTARELIGELVTVPGFEQDQFDPVQLVGVAGNLPYTRQFVDDTVYLADILVDTVNDEGAPCYDTLEHSRVLRALRGDTEQNDRRHQINFYKPNSVVRYTNAERLKYNLEAVRTQGYPHGKERILLSEDSNIIWDGQHRAACLFFLKGNVKVPVRRICFKQTAQRQAPVQGKSVSLYYRGAEEGYQEEKRLLASDIDISKGYTFQLEPGTSHVRFDPTEGEHCVVSDLLVSCGGETLAPQAVNGLQYDGRYYFFTDDPQIELALPSDGEDRLTIRASIAPLGAEALGSLIQQMEAGLADAAQKDAQIRQLAGEITEKQAAIDEKDARLSDKDRQLAEAAQQLEETAQQLAEKTQQQEETAQRLAAAQAVLAEQKTRTERYMEAWQSQENRSKQLYLNARELERALAEAKERGDELQRQRDDLRVHYEDVLQSLSFRLGRAVTWVPRNTRDLLQRKFVLYNYFDDLDNRVNVCSSRFPGSPRKTAVRMIWWNCKSLLKTHRHTEAFSLPGGEDDVLALEEGHLNVGLLLGGGLGDNLIAANYLDHFEKRFGCPEMRVDVFFAAGYKLATSLFEPGVNCDRLFLEMEHISDRYDVFIWVNRYPRVYVADRERIDRFQPELNSYIEACDRFYKEHTALFNESPYHDGETAQMCLAEGKTRIQQADIDGLLGIGKTFTLPMFIHQDEDMYLDSVGLKGKKFITLHRGSDAQYSDRVVKLWPLDRYNALIRMIKEEYPEYTLVQVGISEDRCPAMEGIDLSLVGRTTMEDMKVLLRHAVTHIDGEGGFIHLRQALHAGPSVVLFGPTNMDFYGYADNVNIRGDGCDSPCEWKTKDWLDHCMKGFITPPCMASITPEQVMEGVRSVL